MKAIVIILTRIAVAVTTRYCAGFRDRNATARIEHRVKIEIGSPDEAIAPPEVILINNTRTAVLLITTRLLVFKTNRITLDTINSKNKEIAVPNIKLGDATGIGSQPNDNDLISNTQSLNP